MLAIREAHQALPTTHPSLLVTMGDAKRIYRGRGVRPNLLDLWATRGQLRPAQTPDGHDRRDVRGELLYRLGDISDRLTPVEGSASTDRRASHVCRDRSSGYWPGTARRSPIV